MKCTAEKCEETKKENYQTASKNYHNTSNGSRSELKAGSLSVAMRFDKEIFISLDTLADFLVICESNWDVCDTCYKQKPGLKIEATLFLLNKNFFCFETSILFEVELSFREASSYIQLDNIVSLSVFISILSHIFPSIIRYTER